MDTFVDYYKLLHVQPSAPAAVIKASYRTMLQKLNHHPDRGGDVAFAQLLNAAATTLCSPKARAHYDQLRLQRLAQDQLARNADADGTPSQADPGGSPNRQTRQPSADSHRQAQDTDNASTDKNKPQHNSHIDNERALLAGKAQCPFCLSPYSDETGERRVTHGYANANRCQVCNAARTPIAQVPTSSNDELRRIHRQQHNTIARVWPRWPMSSPVNSVLTDFSPAGCALLHPEILANKSIIMLEAELFNAVCSVVHCQKSGYDEFAVGLEFITLDMLAKPGTLLSASA